MQSCCSEPLLNPLFERRRCELSLWGQADRSTEVPFDASSEALGAFLDCIYNGTAAVKTDVLPELLRLAHRWEVPELQAASCAQGLF